MAVAIGVAAVRVGDKGESFLSFNASALAIFRRILSWVIRLTPLGSGALLGNAIVRYGWQSLSALGSFALAVYIGLGLVLFVVYPLLLLANGLSPKRFYAAAWPAIQLGFVSRSSIATLPSPRMRSSGDWAYRAPIRPLRCPLPRPPKWTAAPPSIRRSRRCSSRNITACRCMSAIMC